MLAQAPLFRTSLIFEFINKFNTLRMGYFNQDVSIPVIKFETNLLRRERLFSQLGPT